MKFLSRRRERLIRDAMLSAKWEIAEKDRMLSDAAREIAWAKEQHLDDLRTIQGLAAACLIIRADPGADIGDEVEALLRDVSDRVAVIEEHMG